jgi:hypothetical protein
MQHFLNYHNRMFNNFAFPSGDCKKRYKTQQLSAGVTALVCVYPSNCSSRDCALAHVTKCLTREMRANSFGVSVVVVVLLLIVPGPLFLSWRFHFLFLLYNMLYSVTLGIDCCMLDAIKRKTLTYLKNFKLRRSAVSGDCVFYLWTRR